jgi:hypothetical protein
VIAPEQPPGFVVRTEAQKAAANNGFRIERGVEAGWLHFASTTVQGDIWIAGASQDGPWLLSIGRNEVGAELGLAPVSPSSGPGGITFVFDALGPLYDALDRTYRLGLSLPDAPLNRFHVATQGLPRGTEAERLVVQRVGQNVFRDALIAYWDGRCPLTGISDASLLRASHIVPWAECTTDEHRLDVHNGLLLSALWDAAFDTGLVSFAEDGTVLACQGLSADARSALGMERMPKLTGLTATHRMNLEWHRARYKF